MHSKAIEAAAEAVRGNMIYVVSAQEAKVFAQAAIAAYLAAMEAEGRDHLITLRTHLDLGTFERYPNVENAIRALSARPNVKG